MAWWNVDLCGDIIVLENANIGMVVYTIQKKGRFMYGGF